MNELQQSPPMTAVSEAVHSEPSTVAADTEHQTELAPVLANLKPEVFHSWFQVALQPELAGLVTGSDSEKAEAMLEEIFKMFDTLSMIFLSQQPATVQTEAATALEQNLPAAALDILADQLRKVVHILSTTDGTQVTGADLVTAVMTP